MSGAVVAIPSFIPTGRHVDQRAIADRDFAAALLCGEQVARHRSAGNGALPPKLQFIVVGDEFRVRTESQRFGKRGRCVCQYRDIVADRNIVILIRHRIGRPVARRAPEIVARTTRPGDGVGVEERDCCGDCRDCQKWLFHGVYLLLVFTPGIIQDFPKI